MRIGEVTDVEIGRYGQREQIVERRSCIYMGRG